MTIAYKYNIKNKVEPHFQNIVTNNQNNTPQSWTKYAKGAACLAFSGIITPYI